MENNPMIVGELNEDELCDLEDELDDLTDRHFWYHLGSDKTRKEMCWTDKDDERLGYLQQLLHG